VAHPRVDCNVVPFEFQMERLNRPGSIATGDVSSAPSFDIHDAGWLGQFKRGSAPATIEPHARATIAQRHHRRASLVIAVFVTVVPLLSASARASS
jgi:hypothetical protein